MSRQLRRLDRRVQFTSTVTLPLCLMLSACGGGGGAQVASIPPPPATPIPTPTPTPSSTIVSEITSLDSPATRSGTHDVIGRLTLTPGIGQSTSYLPASAGEYTFTVDNLLNYQLSAPAGILPAGLTSLQTGAPVISWDLNPPPSSSFHYNNPWEDPVQFLGQRLTAFMKAPDSSETQFLAYDFTRGQTSTLVSLTPNTQLRTDLDYDIGFSYVAMGEWSWRVVDLSGTAAGQFGDLVFVDGDRTPSSGIPASGTATYDARSLALLTTGGKPGIPFTLTADFGQRTISTQIDQDYGYYNEGNEVGGDGAAVVGIHVRGTSPFSNSGTFDIPLTGTANYSDFNAPVTPPSETVVGIMNGAFFGPHAEQVGGTFELSRPSGALLMQDAFVGQQHHP